MKTELIKLKKKNSAKFSYGDVPKIKTLGKDMK